MMMAEPKFWSALRDPPGLAEWLDEEVGLAIKEYVAEGWISISHDGGAPRVTFGAMSSGPGEADITFSMGLRELLIDEVDSLSSADFGTSGEERPLLLAMRDALAEAMALIDRRVAMFTTDDHDA
jgi:hypothetical protein